MEAGSDRVRDASRPVGPASRASTSRTPAVGWAGQVGAWSSCDCGSPAVRAGVAGHGLRTALAAFALRGRGASRAAPRRRRRPAARATAGTIAVSRRSASCRYLTRDERPAVNASRVTAGLNRGGPRIPNCLRSFAVGDACKESSAVRRTASYLAVALASAAVSWLVVPQPTGRRPAVRSTAASLGPASDDLTPDERVAVAVYQAVNRSVVHITTAVARRRRRVRPVRRAAAPAPAPAACSTSKGHILTNYHVVEDARQIDVTLFDGSPTRPGWSAPTRTTTWPCSRSTPRPTSSSRSPGATRPAAGRHARVRHRQPVRPGADADDRHRQQPEPLAPHGEQPHDPRRHPDRRGHQPRQLRRAAAEPPGRAGRHHHGDHQPVRARAPASAWPSRRTPPGGWSRS